MAGQTGGNLIEKIVLEMGYTWNPTSGATDAGIDGFIEIRDPQTGEVTSFILLAQSKAVDREFAGETPNRDRGAQLASRWVFSIQRR